MIENLEGITSHYANHHGIDLLIEARGQLPQEKSRLISVMDRLLNLNGDDKLNFILGRRLGIYNYLDDISDANRYAAVQDRFNKLGIKSREDLEEMFHSLRARVV